VAVDLAGAREGQVAVDLAERPVEGLPPQVRVESVTPTGVSLVLERLQERRVPVTPTTRGELGPGLRLARLTVSPDTATLRGPSSVLRAMAEVSTDAIDLAAITEDATVEVGLAIPRGQVTAASLEGAVPTRFLVKVDVSEETVSRTVEGVTLELPADWTSAVTTVSVRLTGPTRAVSAADATTLRVRAEVPEASTGDARAWTLRSDATEGPRLVVDVPETLAGVRVEVDPLEITRP
jgi:YbbR domain-containing protein